MSEYSDALTELVALPARLDADLGRDERELGAERERREDQLESYAAEHQAILARLEVTLERAHAEGIGKSQGATVRTAKLGSDPLAQAAQLVERLEAALDRALHARRALESEQATMDEAERRRRSEERRRREGEEIQRGEAWERARQGSVGLLIALLVAAALGAVGALSTAAAAAAVPVAALGCAALGASISSTLPVLAMRRATGAEPSSPAAPPRETRLAIVAYAGTGCALAGLVAALVGSGNGATLAVGFAAAVLGTATALTVWFRLPHSG